MNIENAIYLSPYGTEVSGIKCTIDGVTVCVPLDSNNRHYAEILRQVEAGELVIQEAE